jgi:hypothetical protein
MLLTSKHLWMTFGIVGLMAIGAAWVQADDAPVNLKCNLSFNVKFGPPNGDGCMAKAPWYAYFPYDPSMFPQTRPIGTRFPNWPYCPAPMDPTGGENSTQSRYPNWPTQPIARRADTAGPASNIVLTSSTAPCYRPVTYVPPQPLYYAPPPAYYWYGR